MSAAFGELPSMPAAPPVEAAPAPPEVWASTHEHHEPTRRDPRVWATAAFATLAMITAVFASFSPWAHYADGAHRDGVQGDGWFVVVLAVIGAALCGAVVGGVRHLAVRVALAGVGLAMFALYLSNRLRIERAHDLVTGEPLVAGGGLYFVAFAALGFVVAALAMPSTPWWAPRFAAREDTSASS